MEGTNSEVQNGAPIVTMKDGEANMYILAEGALGENAEGILLTENAHVLAEINTEPQLIDASGIAEELVTENCQQTLTNLEVSFTFLLRSQIV